MMAGSRTTAAHLVLLGGALTLATLVAACGSNKNTGSDGGAGSGGPSSYADASSAKGSVTAPDCPGCTFPDKNAPSCAGSAPAIKVVYPIDGVLVPPNMNVMSVQWTPFGGYQTYEVDFSNSITDTRIITKCSTQTKDTAQPSAPSGGCEAIVDQATWISMEAANRAGFPVTITVRGTTDGTCASTSANSVNMSFAQEDVLGAIYYWKSTVTSNGTGGQIWEKSFGDANPEKQVTGTGGALAQSCNGCHALSRDGLRMTVYSDDDDSDDEYSDVTGSLIDMTTKSPIGTQYAGRSSGQPPGFSTFSPDHSYYLASNGLGTAPTNAFALWNGTTGNAATSVPVGNARERPTMPDWSPDGKAIVYVLPTKVASWDQGLGGILVGGGGRNDDDHEFGGSLYTVPYLGNQKFGTPSVFLQSGGENNYYPSYSPDQGFVLFDRAPQDKSVSALEGCTTSPHPLCPNDSFSNPTARVMLMANVNGAAPVDLEKANGSPVSAPEPLSNSWPRWSPFVQSYRGTRLLWITFSSTRDYGVRVRNHKTGMYQCFPPDSVEIPGGAHHSTFDRLCQQPQLWMAAINLSESNGVDPSFPAFWLPFQDITTHNHTPQWTQAVATQPPTTSCTPAGGNCLTDPAACCAGSACNGNGVCVSVIQ